MSVATTWNVWSPCPRPCAVNGDVHAANPALSRLHLNVEFGSDDVNVKLALAIATVPDGPLVIVVSGAVRSTVHVRVAGVGSRFPTRSRTRTLKVCGPSPSSVR